MMKLFLLAALSLSTSSVYAHNCNKSSTGYSWCESLRECICEWETTCPPLDGSDRDKHGCIGSAGETWCKAKNKCIISWEENCNGLRGAFTQFLTDLAVSEEEDPTSTSVDTETGESLSSDSSVDTEMEESLTSVDEE